MDLGPSNVFPLPTGMQFSFVGRGNRRSSVSLPGLCAPPGGSLHRTGPLRGLAAVAVPLLRSLPGYWSAWPAAGGTRSLAQHRPCGFAAEGPWWNRFLASSTVITTQLFLIVQWATALPSQTGSGKKGSLSLECPIPALGVLAAPSTCGSNSLSSFPYVLLASPSLLDPLLQPGILYYKLFQLLCDFSLLSRH